MNSIETRGRLLLALVLSVGIAACGGGSSKESPPASSLRLETAAAVTQTIGPAGGTLTTTAADGTAYTLTVPAKALRSATAITLAPIASIADLPAGVSLAGGAHLTPEGQTFDVPVTLELVLASAPIRTPVPFTYSRELQERHLYPATVAGRSIEFEIVHFSGYAALLGQDDVALVHAVNTYLPTPTAAGDQALQALVDAALMAPSAARSAAIHDALRGWLDNVIKPAVVANQAMTSIDVNPASSAPSYVATTSLRQEMQVFNVALKYALISGAGASGNLDAVTLEFQVAVKDAALHVIPLFNAACDSFAAAYLLAVPDIFAWQALAVSSSAAPLAPALDRAAVLQALCVQVAYDPNGGTDFTAGIQPGDTGTLSVRAGYRINGGPVLFDSPMFVVLTGASGVTPAGLLAPFAVAAGDTLQQQFVWQPATTEMRIEVDACLDDYQDVLREVCQQAFVVRGTPTGNTCPLYHVNVRGLTDTSRVFHVSAQAGFSESGAYGGATLGGGLTLSLTSGYPGTATAQGEVSYLVAVENSTAPIENLWRWSVRSNVNAGGSCTATVSVGGVARSITVTANDERVLDIPVAVRHGDVLQTKLIDAICTSPGLLPGPPEVLVNANIGMTLVPLANPAVRYRPVMCTP